MIFSSPGDSKLTPDGLGLQWNRQSKTFWMLNFELLGRNIGPLHVKTDRVAETALRKSWFLSTLARFPGTWGIFCSPEESKLSLDGLGLQWNEHSKTFWRLGVELVGQNIAPLHFKTYRVAETLCGQRDFDQLPLNFPELGAYIPVPGTLNYLLMPLVFSETNPAKLFERSVSSF